MGAAFEQKTACPIQPRRSLAGEVIVVAEGDSERVRRDVRGRVRCVQREHGVSEPRVEPVPDEIRFRYPGESGVEGDVERRQGAAPGQRIDEVEGAAAARAE